MTTEITVHAPVQEYNGAIRSIHVKLYVGVDAFEWLFTENERSHAFEIEFAEGEPLQYDYQWKAFYSDGGSTLSGRHQATDRVLVIHPSRLDLGILDLMTLCPPMDFGSITVSVEVANQRQDIVYLSPTVYGQPKQHDLRFAVGSPISGDYRYKTRYTLHSGQVVETDWCETGANPLVVPSLFLDRRSFLFTAPLPGAVPPPEFRLSVKHSDAYGVEEDRLISLGAEAREAKVEFGVIDPATARFSYQGFVLMPDGTTQSIPETDLVSSLVLLEANAIA